MDVNLYTEANGIYFGDEPVYGPISEARIRDAERDLGVTFPPSYRNFLLHLGAIGDIAGLPGPEPSAVEWTWFDVVEQNRSYWTDLHGVRHASPLIYLEPEGGDAWFFLDFSRVDPAGECPVVIFGPFHDPPVVLAATFFDYIQMRYGVD